MQQPDGGTEARADSKEGSAAAAPLSEGGGRWIILLCVLAGALFVDVLLASMLAPLLPALSTRFSLSQQSIFFLLSLRVIASVAMAVPPSCSLSSLNQWLLLIAALFGLVSVCALLGLRHDWPSLAAAFFLQGLSHEFIWKGGVVLASKIFSKRDLQGEPCKGEEANSLEVTAHSPSPLQAGHVIVLATRMQSRCFPKESKGWEGEGLEEGRSEGTVSSLDEGAEGFSDSEESEEEREESEGDEDEEEMDGGEGEGGEGDMVGGSGSPGNSLSALVLVTNRLYMASSAGGVIGPLLGAVLFQFAAPWLPWTVVGSFAAGVMLLSLVVNVWKKRRRECVEKGQSAGGAESRGDRLQGRGREGNVSVNQDDISEQIREVGLERQLEGALRFQGGQGPVHTLEQMGGGEGETKREVKLEVGEAEGKREVRAGEKERGSCGSAEDDVSHGKKRIGSSMLWKTWMNSKMPTVMAILTIEAMAFAMVEAILPFHLASVCSFSYVQTGAVFAVCQLAYFITGLYVDSAIECIGSLTSMLVGLVLVASALPLVSMQGPFCSSLAQALLLTAFGGGSALVITPSFPLMVDILEGDFATARAHFSSSFSLGLLLGPLLAGLLTTFLLPVEILCIVSSVAVAIMLIVWLRWSSLGPD